MQIKNIEKMVRRTGIIEIVEGGDNLWIGNGFAEAPLFDFRRLSEEQALALFNVGEKEREKIRVSVRPPEEDEFADAWEAEELLPPAICTVGWGGYDLAAIPGSLGMLFVQTAYIAPFVKEDPQTRLYVRWTDAAGGVKPLIAVKSGVFLKGLIEPVENVLSQAFAEMLETLARETRRVIGYPTDAEEILHVGNLL